MFQHSPGSLHGLYKWWRTRAKGRTVPKGETDDRRPSTQMVHFRTLDWEMDPLRKVVVQLAVCHQATWPCRCSLPRSLTYVGFVATLTGVRRDLSMSLNFRPYHNQDHSWQSNILFHFHRLAVVLGFRPSISSLLRHYFCSSGQSQSLAGIERNLPSTSTTAAYLTFSDGQKTVVLEKEKDRITATIRSSTSFVTITNHDVSTNRPPPANLSLAIPGIKEGTIKNLFEDSEERSDCIAAKWRKPSASRKPRTSTGSRGEVCITKQTLIRWLGAWPTTNDQTHYAAIMDPLKGEFAYARLYKEPLEAPDE